MKRITKIEGNKLALVKKKIRVAAYCRVSTASNDQLASLDAQKAHYEEYIKSNSEWQYAGLFYDKGITGTKKECRDGLLALMDACEEGEIDLVITKSVSRFSRNTTDCLELVRKLLDLNVTVIFEKENINTGTMESELMLSILSGLAASESASISKNVKWSIQNRYRSGTFIIATPPYGYENIDGEMSIVPEQADVVKKIFADTLAGKGTNDIVRELNELGIASKRNGKWNSRSISAIIRNEKYTGDVLFQKTYTDSNFNRHNNTGEENQYLCEGHHEPIVSHEVFQAANEVLNQRGLEKGNGKDTWRYQNRYAFSSKIRCGECGGVFKRRRHYKPSGEYVAWCCTRHISDKHSCSMKFITDEGIKTAFITMMNKLIFANKAILKPMLNSVQWLDDREGMLKLQEYETLLEKNAEQKQVLTRIMASGLLEPAVFTKENNALTLEEMHLQEEKRKITASLTGDRTRSEALGKLVKSVSNMEMMKEFSDELFLEHVDWIEVLSRKEIIFVLKCGLHLKERLVG